MFLWRPSWISKCCHFDHILAYISSFELPKETKSRITIKSLKMLLVAVLIAILNFKIVANFNLHNKKDKDTFCMLKFTGIINV